jgi:5'-deoxynucleotidase YfbR-like HD superfamily hydrolase
MTWMLTYTGHTVDLEHLEPVTIDACDIAHALAVQARFCGHTRRKLSIAEHCLMTVEILERDHQVRDPMVLLAGLLHEAHLYLTGDMASPWKQMLAEACTTLDMPNLWALHEARVQQRLLRYFGALEAWQANRTLVQAADQAAKAAERRDLMHPNGPKWQLCDEHPAPAWLKLGEQDHMTDEDWEQAFNDRFDSLIFAGQLRQPEMAQG